jgi:hypothetical protein
MNMAALAGVTTVFMDSGLRRNDGEFGLLIGARHRFTIRLQVIRRKPGSMNKAALAGVTTVFMDSGLRRNDGEFGLLIGAWHRFTIRLHVIPAKAGIHEHGGTRWSHDDVHGFRPPPE